MKDSLKSECFFVSVPAEAKTVSPFPTFDESLAEDSTLSAETEIKSDDSEGSETEEDEETSDDESSAPTIPEDIGFVVDAKGNDIRHIIEKPYRFDKVMRTTKIDVDDAISHLNKMQELLPGSALPPVIPALPSTESRVTVLPVIVPSVSSSIPSINSMDMEDRSAALNKL